MAKQERMTAEEFIRSVQREERKRRSAPRSPGSKVDYSPKLLPALKGLGLPYPAAEFKFHPPRKWPFDFSWWYCELDTRREVKVALEVEGGVDSGVGHAHPVNFRTDIEKYNRAVLDGWTLLRCMPGMLELEDGRAILWIEEALKG